MQLGKRIGVGATAELYECSEGKLFKCFHSNVSNEVIQTEYRLTQAVQNLSIRVPKLYEKMVLDSGDRGYVMEKLEGKSLEELVLAASAAGQEKEITQMCVEFARLHARMHQIEGVELPEGHSWLKNRISWNKELTEQEKAKLYECIDKLPQKNCLCHNDYHPGNLIVKDDEYSVIDWCDGCSGNPWMDVARTVFVFKSVYVPPEYSKEEADTLNNARKQMGELYLNTYLEATGESDEELKKWMPLVAASRLFVESGADKENMLAIVKNYLSNI